MMLKIQADRRNDGNSRLIVFTGFSVLVHIMVLHLAEPIQIKSTAESGGSVAVTLISRYRAAEPKHEFLVSEAKAPSSSASVSRKPKPPAEHPAVSAKAVEQILREEPDESGAEIVSGREKKTDAESEPAEKPAALHFPSALSAESAPEAAAPVLTEQEMSFLTEHMRQKVRSQLTYPQLARRMGWNGTVMLRVYLTENGGVEKTEIILSSGFKALDKEAFESVYRAAPYENHTGEEVIVELPVRFSLSG
ncbi:energy transducer TonB [Geovibrio ferrireducens]|uniref:energy transducer TonB n=1 Tax=Geovibrio ferrireducens TaxID=46201 RepID=UPI00224669F1|nr:energy transducer TonB [Geovibrio ferrireducens]